MQRLRCMRTARAGARARKCTQMHTRTHHVYRGVSVLCSALCVTGTSVLVYQSVVDCNGRVRKYQLLVISCGLADVGHWLSISWSLVAGCRWSVVRCWSLSGHWSLDVASRVSAVRRCQSLPVIVCCHPLPVPGFWSSIVSC